MKKSSLLLVSLLATLAIVRQDTFAADQSWDGDSTVANAQYGPSPAIWTSAAGDTHWLPGNTVTGTANAPWDNAPFNIAQFKSGTTGTNPGTLTINLGENINVNKIDVGGSFAPPITITNSGANAFVLNFGGTTPALAPNGAALTIDTSITGTAGLNKINGGQAILTKANTYTGGTSISTGILTASNALSYSSGTVSTSGTGQALVNAVTVANAFSLNGGAGTGAVLLQNGGVSGLVTLAGNSVIGAAGTGTISGGINGAANLSLPTGTVNFTGAGVSTMTGTTTIEGATVNLNRAAGGTALAGNILVNSGTLTWGATNQIDDGASITVNGGSVLNTVNRADTLANLTINSTAVNTFSALNITNTLTVATGIQDAVNSGGTLTTNRAVLSGASNTRLGANSGTSTWNVGAGGLEMNGASIQFGNAGGAFAATLNLNGNVTATGANTFTAPNTAAARTVNLQGGTRNFAINSGVTTLETNVTLSNGTLTKSGAGTLVLQSASTLASATVNGGALQVGIGGVGSFAGPAIVNAGATLSGTGNVIGNVSLLGGILSPGDLAGNSAGTLNVNGGLLFGAGSNARWQLATPESNVGLNNFAAIAALTDPVTLSGADDFANVLGVLTGGGSIGLDFTGYTPVFGDVFDLVDFASFAGSVPNFSVVGGSLGSLSINSSRFADLGVIVITPEPGRGLLLLLASSAFLARRRRRCV